ELERVLQDVGQVEGRHMHHDLRGRRRGVARRIHRMKLENDGRAGRASDPEIGAPERAVRARSPSRRGCQHLGRHPVEVAARRPHLRGSVDRKADYEDSQDRGSHKVLPMRKSHSCGHAPRRSKSLTAVMFVAVMLVSCARHHRSVTIATTTSVDGSGLLQILRVNFEKQTGIRLNAFIVGSGRALRMASQGKADMTITHDPEAERAFVARYKPELYRQFAWNDFIIVGPAADPAGVAHAHSASEAFRMLHDAQAKFLSRNDESGTNMRELSLWRAAGVTPRSNPGYVPIGQPMATLLRSADEMGAYTLSDRATFDNLAPTLHIVILVAGDPVLRNVYAVTLMRRPDSEEHRNATMLARWI